MQGVHQGYRNHGWPQCFIDVKNSSDVVGEIILSFVEGVRRSDIVEKIDNSTNNDDVENGVLSTLCIN